MNIAFYNGVSGLVAYQENLNILSHNMANVNTTGYKATRASFSDLLYTRMNIHKNYTEEVTQALQAAADAQAANAAGGNAGAQAQNVQDAQNAIPKLELVGHGIRLAYNDLVYGQGIPLTTNLPLDFAIVGEGFFAVDKGNGNIQYTRNGAFDISMEGTKGYLTTSDGSYVLDNSGKKIELSYLEGSNQQQFDFSDLPGKIGIYQFKNPFGLEQAEGSCFKPTPISGAAEAAKNDEKYDLIQNALESSTVDIGQQMVDVMETQRAFQMNSKIVQTADQMEEIINNLR